MLKKIQDSTDEYIVRHEDIQEKYSPKDIVWFKTFSKAKNLIKHMTNSKENRYWDLNRWKMWQWK